MLDHTAAVDAEPKPEPTESTNKVKVLQRLEEMKRNFF